MRMSLLNAHRICPLQTYGYCASIISSTIGQPGWYSYFHLPQEGEPGYASITTPAIATANGVFSAGGAVGSLLIMWSCDYFGRKVNIQLGAFFSVLGGALQGGAENLKCVPDLPLISWPQLTV